MTKETFELLSVWVFRLVFAISTLFVLTIGVVLFIKFFLDPKLLFTGVVFLLIGAGMAFFSIRDFLRLK